MRGAVLALVLAGCVSQSQEGAQSHRPVDPLTDGRFSYEERALYAQALVDGVAEQRQGLFAALREEQRRYRTATDHEACYQGIQERLEELRAAEDDIEEEAQEFPVEWPKARYLRIIGDRALVYAPIMEMGTSTFQDSGLGIEARVTTLVVDGEQEGFWLVRGERGNGRMHSFTAGTTDGPIIVHNLSGYIDYAAGIRARGAVAAPGRFSLEDADERPRIAASRRLLWAWAHRAESVERLAGGLLAIANYHEGGHVLAGVAVPGISYDDSEYAALLATGSLPRFALATLGEAFAWTCAMDGPHRSAGMRFVQDVVDADPSDAYREAGDIVLDIPDPFRIARIAAYRRRLLFTNTLTKGVDDGTQAAPRDGAPYAERAHDTNSTGK